MSQFIATLFFNCRNFGWSEVYPTVATSYANAIVTLQTLASDRLQMLCSDVTLMYGRVSDQNVRGDSAIANVFGTGVWDTSPNPTVTFDDDITYTFRVEGTPLYRATRHLRGLPTSEFTGSNFLPGIPYKATITTWMQDMIEQCAVSTAIKPKPATPPYYIYTPITSVTYNRQSHRKAGRPFGIVPGRRLIA